MTCNPRLLLIAPLRHAGAIKSSGLFAGTKIGGRSFAAVWGSMARAEYYRKQAEICGRLAGTVEGEVAHRLRMMAEEYRATAARAEAENEAARESHLALVKEADGG